MCRGCRQFRFTARADGRRWLAAWSLAKKDCAWIYKNKCRRCLFSGMKTEITAKPDCMKNNEQTEVSQPPIGIAAFACMVCLGVVYLTAAPVVSWLHIWWARVLIYSVIPISAAFNILYRSSWHHELPRAKRILSIILSSCIAFCGVVLFGFVIIAGLYVAFNRISAFKD